MDVKTGRPRKLGHRNGTMAVEDEQERETEAEGVGAGP